MSTAQIKWIPGIERAFCGTGGNIFFKWYMEALFDHKFDKTLQSLSNELQSSMEEFDADCCEKELYDRLRSQVIDNDQAACQWLVSYLTEVNTRESWPEVCGYAVALMVKRGWAEYAKKILEYEDWGDGPIYWDS